MSDELVRPAGDPAQIEQFAAQLEKAGADTGHVASGMRQQSERVREQARWTGDAADSYTDFTSGMSRSVGALALPLQQATAPLQSFAESLRKAQQQCDAYDAAYSRLYPLTAQSGSSEPIAPMVDIELADKYNQAQAAVTDYNQQASIARKVLLRLAAEMTEEFLGPKGPFRNFVEKSHLPWDALAGDAVIEHFIAGGEQAEDALKDSEKLPQTIQKLQDDLVKPVVDEIEAGTADARTNLNVLLQALEKYQVKKGETVADVEKALAKADPDLARNLSGLKSMATTADVIGFLAGLYMVASPPAGDQGAWRAGDHIAGAGTMAGSSISIAKNSFGVDFSSIEVDLGPIESLDFVPYAGMVISVASGIYITVDWAIHHPKEAEYLLAHPQVAWCNFVANFYGKQMWEEMGCAPRPSI